MFRDKEPENQINTVVEWHVHQGLLPYENALSFMEKRVDAIQSGKLPELIWLVEHPPLITAGTSAVDSDLLDSDRFPVYRTGRGGQFTYHGPGQRVVYVMLDLNKRRKDVRWFVAELEAWLINALAECGIEGKIRDGRVGVWVDNNGRDEKIAALGIRLKKWVSLHGLSININPNLGHFSSIVPCGLNQYGVTSTQALAKSVTMAQFDDLLKTSFEKRFGPVQPVSHIQVETS